MYWSAGRENMVHAQSLPKETTERGECVLAVCFRGRPECSCDGRGGLEDTREGGRIWMGASTRTKNTEGTKGQFPHEGGGPLKHKCSEALR